MTRTSPVNTGYTIIAGTTSGSNGSKVDTWIEYKVTSQSVANNTSTIRVILYSQATISSTTKWEVASNYGYVGYDNGNKQYLSTTYDFSNKQVNKFGDYTYTIAHNSDGTKTITLQGSWSTSHSSYISGGTVPASGVSSSVTLPQIARASSVSNFTGTLGSAGTITITRASSSFTHTLQYSFDNSNWTNIATDVGTSYSWTPSVSLISNFSNQKTKTGYIRCITYSGGTNVGSKTSTMTLSVPSTTLGSVSATIGKSVTLTATNPCASGLTYQFAYSNGSTWTNIGSAQTGKTISWSVPTSLIGNISNAKSKEFSIRVITKIGSVEVNTASATATLTIPPNTSQAITGTIGSAVSIPITKAHSNLTTTIAYSFGSSGTTTIVSKTTSTSYSWTPPTSLLTQIPNSISGTGSITITTYNGSASCGSNNYTLTLSAASSVVPTSSLSLAMVNNNSTVAGWGIYLQGYSQVRATLTGNGVSGSTIKNMSVTGSGLSASSSPSTASATLTQTSSVLQTSGTLTYKGNVSDSRNRNATEKSQSISVVAYTPPNVTNISLARSNSSGTIDSTGTYLKVKYTLTYSTAGNHNTASVSLRYKATSDASWTDYGAVANGSNLNLNLRVANNYEAQLIVSDSLNTNESAIINIPSAERVLNVNGSGSGLAIGGFSTDAGKLQVYYPTDFEGNTLPTINNLPFVAEAKGFALFGGTQIPANSDLNDDTFVGAGTWWCNSNADAQTLSNCPTKYGFRMIVMKTLRPATPSGSGFNWNMALQTIYDYWGNIYTRYIGYMDDDTTKRVGDWQTQTYNYTSITETSPTAVSASRAYGLVPDNSVGVVALRRNDRTEWICLVQRNSQYWGSVLMTGQANEGTKKFLLQNGTWKPERWFAEEFYNDTSGSTWQEMIKNKIDYVKSNYPTGHVYILAGGWSGQMYGYSIVNFPTSTQISVDFYGINGKMNYHGHWDGTNYTYKDHNVGIVQIATGTNVSLTGNASNTICTITLGQGTWLIDSYCRVQGAEANEKYEIWLSNYYGALRQGNFQNVANSPMYMQHHITADVGFSGYTFNFALWHSSACSVQDIQMRATRIGNN